MSESVKPSRSRRIDAHHHLWRYVPSEYDWIGDDMASLRRDFLVEDLIAAMERAGVDSAIAVQARCTMAETEWLLECASATDRIAAVVGWLPLTDPHVSAVVERSRSNTLFRGAREVAQGQPPGFLLRPEFQKGITALTGAQLAYDILIYADQLAEATQLVALHPEQTFVLDHAAKPLIARSAIEPWSRDLRELAKRPNVFCKLSGLVTEANWSAWTAEQLSPYLDTCVEAFGPDRLLAGSDWPVCLVATAYKDWWQVLRDFFASYSTEEQEAVFGRNACQAYRLQA